MLAGGAELELGRQVEGSGTAPPPTSLAPSSACRPVVTRRGCDRLHEPE